MTERKRVRLSAAQRVELWRRWKAGQSLHEIGRALGKNHVVIQFLLARHGGIAPPVRHRSRLALTLAEREDISRGIASGCSIHVIAKGLERVASTVLHRPLQITGLHRTWHFRMSLPWNKKPPCGVS